MRIVHDIEHPAKVILGAQPYTKKITDESSHSWIADLTLYIPDGEEVHIHGNARHILAVLKETVSVLEQAGADFVKDGVVRSDWETYELPVGLEPSS